MAAWQMFLAWSHLKSAGFPAGGALEFVQAIERRFLDLGGEIHYNERVEKILVENGKATGVRLADGKNHRADFVISAADGRSTIFDMLEGKFLDEKIRLLYKRLPVGPTVIMVALGVNRLFNDLPHCAFGTVFKLKEPVTIAGVNMSWLRPMVYNFDPSLSPAGKTLVRVVLPADYDYWKSQGWNTLRYRAEKEKAAEMVIALLEQRFPGILRQVEMRDVATPLTFERYTGNWRGSIIGWGRDHENFPVSAAETAPRIEKFLYGGALDRWRRWSTRVSPLGTCSHRAYLPPREKDVFRFHTDAITINRGLALSPFMANHRGRRTSEETRSLFSGLRARSLRFPDPRGYRSSHSRRGSPRARQCPRRNTGMFPMCLPAGRSRAGSAGEG